ncbi:MAG: LysR family transcriptional regulator, partial [Polaromonas sp.]|nr:LysR family transcriptional regulator [Polaromonas sp.]
GSIALHGALDGRGIVSPSEIDRRAARAGGRLVRLFAGHLGEPAPLYAVVPSRQYVPARVNEVIERLSALLTERLAALPVPQAG